MEDWSVGKLLEWTTGFFRGKGIALPRLEAEILLAFILSCRRIDLYAMYESNVVASDRERFRELIKRRTAGCPVAYLIGSKEFFGLDFQVSPHVLIPRPETETLVETALTLHKNEPIGRFIDVGTGSGCIVVTLLKRWPNARAWALDISPDALAVARANAEKHGVADRVVWIEHDLLRESQVIRDLASGVDLVVSNPPYIPRQDITRLDVTVKDYEPSVALDGGDDGLVLIMRLIAEAAPLVRPGGQLLFEFGFDQASAIQDLLDRAEAWIAKPLIVDHARIPRIAHLIKRGEQITTASGA